MVGSHGAALCAAALSCAAHAQTLEAVEPYREVADPAVQVRGHAVVGVSIASEAEDQRSDRVWVRLGERLPSQVRLEVVSPHGRLRGEGLWRVRPERGADWPWVSISTPPSPTRAASVGQLAAAVQPVQDAGGLPRFHLAAWGNRPPQLGSSVKLRVYVNTRRGTMAVFSGPQDRNGTRCKPIDSQGVRYDAICDLELVLDAATGVKVLEVIRQDGGRTQTQSVEIVW